MTRATRTCRLAVATTLLMVVVAGRAQAEALWVPVLVDQGSAPSTLEVVRVLGTVLRTEHGIEMLDPAQAAQRFEHDHSIEPVKLADDTLAALRGSIDRAVEHVGHGEYKTADEHLSQLFSLSDPVQDYVRRKLAVSKDLFELCLVDAGAKLREGRPESAKQRMRACILGSLEQELPTSRSWEPAIGELYKETRASLFGSERAKLTVDVGSTEATAASRQGCVASINGSPQGPVRWEGQLLPGSVRVSVHCTLSPGRIYVRKLTALATQSVIVDRRFDTAVHTADFLSLRYTDDRTQGLHSGPDGVAAAKIVGGSDLLLITEAKGGGIQIARIDTALSRKRASVQLGPAPSDTEILAAARALVEGRSGSIVAASRNETSTTTATGQGEDRCGDGRCLRDGPGATRLVAGVGAAALSAGLYSVAWLQYVEADDARSRFRQSANPASLVRYEDKVISTVGYAAFGAGAGAIAVVALLPDAEGAIPWWSWAVGAAGAATAGAGLYLYADGEDCTLSRCTASSSRTDPSLGALVATHAVPLLSVPLTHIVRALSGDTAVRASASAAQDGVSVSAGGRF